MIGILGGTFDPIHNGHLTIATKTLAALNLQRVEFIPCHTPAHRVTPIATPQQRFNLLEIALKDHSNFHANPIEIERHGISYAIDTLKALQDKEPLCFILGVDAFLNFDKWKEWQTILEYCHLVIINRPEFSFKLSPELDKVYQQHSCENPDQLNTTPHGLIHTLSIDPVAISATDIRHKLAHNESLTNLVPESVLEYIQKNKLYA